MLKLVFISTRNLKRVVWKEFEMMPSRRLTRSLQNELGVHIEKMILAIEDMLIHERDLVQETLHIIGEQAGISIAKPDLIILAGDQKFIWSEIIGKPARDPSSWSEYDLRLEELLELLRKENNLKAYNYVLADLAEYFSLEMNLDVGRKP